MEIPQKTSRISTWDKNPPKRYEYCVSFVALITNDGELSCYQEAMDDVESAKWKIEKEEEMDWSWSLNFIINLFRLFNSIH